jgi:uncharacterized protein (DUF2336 family)
MFQALITELNATLTTASEGRHLSILRQVTDLFLERADVLSAGHVAVFDDVFVLLIRGMNEAALIELSRRIAPVENTPSKLVDILSCHDNIAVAGPALENANSLAEEALAGIAGTASRKHLQAIAARAQISETVTDILVDRGDGDLACKLVANPGARLSELGFVKLINRAKTDNTLAGLIAARSDLPPELEPFLRLALAS